MKHAMITMLFLILWVVVNSCSEATDVSDADFNNVNNKDVNISIEVGSNKKVDVDGSSTDTLTPKCLGSLIQESYKNFDDECSNITQECVIMPTPKPFEGCYCLVCGFLGYDKRCFYVCCNETCNPYQ